MNFSCFGQSAQVDFLPQHDGFLAKLRERLEQQSPGELNLNHLGSDESKILLQSPTASTTVQIVGTQAIVRTQYFGKYVAPDAHDERLAYTQRKLGTLLDLLTEAQVRLQLFGISTIARCSAAGKDPCKLREATANAFGLSQLSEGDDVFDFTLRVSRAVDNEFSNIVLLWYQTRTATVVQPGFAGLSLPAVWQMTLSEEGLELRYDRNNKRGLFKGKSDWTREEFLEIALRSIRGIPAALRGIEQRINENMD